LRLCFSISFARISTEEKHLCSRRSSVVRTTLPNCALLRPDPVGGGSRRSSRDGFGAIGVGLDKTIGFLISDAHNNRPWLETTL
jgi:hypothetical protein